MSKKKREKVLILPNGEKVNVKKESGKFYLCDGCSFRKGNPDIKVETVILKEPDAEEVEEKGDE